MNDSLIVFLTTFYLNNSPEDLTFTDTTPYVANGVVLADVKGILKITSPSGVLYKNVGWDTDDFSSEDIDADVSLSKSGIALPLDADGNVLAGEYIVEYKVDVSGTVYTATPAIYNFCFTNPVVDIDIASNCATSVLTSTDSYTDYDIDCSGITAVSYDSITRTHTVEYPAGLGISDIVEAGAVVTVGPNIYTKIWITTISSILQYTLPCGLIITTTVTGDDSHTVKCDECQCDLLPCIDTLKTRWEEYLGTNPSEADRLQLKMMKIQASWMLYSMSIRCGETDDAAIYCAEIVSLVSSETTCCSDDADTSSREIIPVSGSGGGGSITYYNVLYNGTGEPSVSLGNNNDYYICTIAGGAVLVGDFYKKIAGSWVYQCSLKGADGSDATSKYGLLNNDLTAVGTDAAVLEKDLMTYTLPTNTLSVNNDYIKVSAFIRLATNANQKTIRLYWGGDLIEAYIVTGTVTTKTKFLTVESAINRTSATGQDIEIKFTRQGSPAACKGPNWASDTKNLAAPIDIKITGQNAVASADDIICEQLKVEHFKQ